jgi:hypothetical protein
MRSSGMVIFCCECNELFKENDIVAIAVIPDKYNDNISHYFHDSCIEDNMLIKRRVLASELQHEIVFGREIVIYDYVCKWCGKKFKTNIEDSKFCKIKCSTAYHHRSASERSRQDATVLHM